jgi:hypothetical protein
MDRGELHIGGVAVFYTTILRVVTLQNTPHSEKFREAKKCLRNLIEQSPQAMGSS